MRCWTLLVLAACGRVRFDPTTDGASADGPPASCGALAPTCGPTGTSPCCESLVVPGGSYFRSYDGVIFVDMGFPATVSAFRLDKYEITVGRFREFVNAGYGTQQQPPAAMAGARTLNGTTDQGGWDLAWTANLRADTATLVASLKCASETQTWTDTPGGNENRPINCISWYDAMAFCIWDGGFLPTEAEWNFVAHGGDQQRRFPWSNPPTDGTIDDSSYASYWVDMTKRCMGDGVTGCTLEDLVPVGSKPAGDAKWGHADLSGNVWEWVLDFSATPYPTASCTGCANLSTAPTRVLRGGSLDDPTSSLLSGNRNSNIPGYRNFDVGARCARVL